VETNIIYKYRDLDAPPGSETTITTKVLDLDPKEVLTSFHLNGQTITLEADDPDEHGDGSREYVILERHPLITQWGGSGAAASILFVVVTDADA
jgi:hypothetical protein